MLLKSKEVPPIEFISELESLKQFFKIVDIKITNYRDLETGKDTRKFNLIINAVIIKE